MGFTGFFTHQLLREKARPSKHSSNMSVFSRSNAAQKDNPVDPNAEIRPLPKIPFIL